MTREARRGTDMTAGEFGDRAILDVDLAVERVPAPGTPFWMEVALFALTFDGYQYRGAGLGGSANKHVDRFAKDWITPAGPAARRPPGPVVLRAAPVAAPRCDTRGDGGPLRRRAPRGDPGSRGGWTIGPDSRACQYRRGAHPEASA